MGQAKQNIVIIGAGIVGTSTAMQLSQKLPNAKITIIEKEQDIAVHQTGNNSGVIHSGIYYKPGSEKALNCAKGYKMMIDFCRANEIPFDICGKIIVANTEQELPLLDNIFKRGVENGIKGIRNIDTEEAKSIEPYVNCLRAVWVPQAGIVNYKAVAKKYGEIFNKNNGTIAFDNKVVQIVRDAKSIKVITTQQEISCDLVINCSGLYADKVARLTMPEYQGQVIPFRGEYYKIKSHKSYLVRNLIYPTPNPNFPFLGVHFTRMINGGIEAGPNAVLAFKREGYHRSQVDFKELFEIVKFPGFHKIVGKYWRDGLAELYRSYRKSAFVAALQKLVPEITINDIEVGGAGVRAQICNADGALLDDFYITQKIGIINVINAPSPAATASLAIGDKISSLAMQQLK